MAEANQLVIIGNGFDLAHGLKTSYSNFVVWYLQQIVNKACNAQCHKDELLTMESNSIINNPKAINCIQDFMYFREIYKNYCTVQNISPMFKKIISHQQELNWVNIESIYYESLTTLYKEIEKNDHKIDSSAIKKLTTINAELDCLRNSLEVYLTEVNKNKNTNEKIKNVLMNNFGHSIKTSAFNPNILFVNFNYTSTVELYKDVLYKDHSINYIHGKLGEARQPLIFGYGDETDSYYEKIERLNLNEFLSHFKSFGYFKNDNYRNLLNFVDAERFEVSIMGHSCGLSDRVLLSHIFSHKNCTSVKIYYHERDKSHNNYTSLTHEISRHFSDKSRMRAIIKSFERSEPLVKV